MREFHNEHRPTYKELLEGAPSPRLNPSDAIVEAHLEARGIGSRVMTVLVLVIIGVTITALVAISRFPPPPS